MKERIHLSPPGPLAMIAALLLVLTGTAAAENPLQPGFDQATLATLNGRTRAWGLAMADFNGDGIPDIISGDTYGDVNLYLGDGSGNFTFSTIVINNAYHNSYGIAAGDFNGDGSEDFAMTMTVDYGTTILDGQIQLYLGNGAGTFQAAGYPQAGLVVGDAGIDVMSLTCGDVDGDGDLDIISGDIITSENSAADLILFRNEGNDASDHPTWSTQTIISAQNILDPEVAPYYPPLNYLQAYGLALGDFDGDGDPDLIVSDRASYLYIMRNDGTGNFSFIRYESVSTRPWAYTRIHDAFTTELALACEDINGDGLVDFITGGCDSTWDGTVDLWLNAGNDSSGRPRFTSAGAIGQSGTDARGLAVGHINPSADAFIDIVFGNYEGDIVGLTTNRTDSDGDGIIDLYDNAPFHANAPRLDMNTDGSLNYIDQLDNDQDDIGDPADEDDDNDGVPDDVDNSPFVANPDQADYDGDGRGDVSDPLNNVDSDGDGIFDGPIDPVLYEKARIAKAIWSQSDTHFIIRIDALGRAFQNEFTQIMSDAAILSPQEWEAKKFDSYNGIGDSPAVAGYQVPEDLPGGKNTPLTLVVIPKKIWDAFGDPDPIWWINDRISNPNLEIGQHGTYHNNNTPYGDWADMTDRNFYSCETCGFSVEEMYQYLLVGKHTLLGEYENLWTLTAGADPETSPKIDWSNAANPLITYAPPFNASDTLSREAMARLFMAGFSASVWEENSSIFAPEGSSHEQFDSFGMFHASADLQVDPEIKGHGNKTYTDYLDSITQYGSLNTWLIEEVEWSSRYCNDLPRLEDCPDAPGGINRENNMVDPERWLMWMELLDFVNANGQPMTMGDYSLAMAFDNAPTVANPDQADSDHDGIGDVIEDVTIAAQNTSAQEDGGSWSATLTATLQSPWAPLAGQTLVFSLDCDGDGETESFTAQTDAAGTASVTAPVSRKKGTATYDVSWDGILVTAQAQGRLTIPCTLNADLTGDCMVNLVDLAVLAGQWLESGDPAACPLSADIAGDDCIIDGLDLAVMAEQWLMSQ